MMGLCQCRMCLFGDLACHHLRCNLSHCQQYIAYLPLFTDRVQSPIPVPHVARVVWRSICFHAVGNACLLHSSEQLGDPCMFCRRHELSQSMSNGLLV